MLVARGTSDNAALFGRYLLEITTGIPVSLAAPSIATALRRAASTTATPWSSRSRNPGESTDTNLVLERAREQGAITHRHHQRKIEHAGANSPSTRLPRARRQGTQRRRHQDVHRPGADPVPASPPRSAAPSAATIWNASPSPCRTRSRSSREIAALSERYRFMRYAVVVGRGLNYANAFEFALKLMETCYVVAERFSSADFLHGPIALVEPNFPVFAFAPPGVTWPSIGETLRKLHGLHADILAITDRGNREVDALRHEDHPPAAAHERAA